MRRLCLFLCLLLTACTAEATQTPSTTVQTPLTNAQSAVINLNIFNRDATLSASIESGAPLFSADVGNTDDVNYVEDLDEQVFIALSSQPDQLSTETWKITTSREIPMSYVVDVTNGAFDADLSGLNLPRFDLVATDSELDILLPSSSFQMVVDSNNSPTNLIIPSGAQVQSAQLTTQGGLMTLSVGEGVRFIGNLSVTSGGATITVPSSTGVQLIIDHTENSEITLPERPRSIAEEIIYQTPSFDQSTAQILLTSSLVGAAIRIIQE